MEHKSDEIFFLLVNSSENTYTGYAKYVFNYTYAIVNRVHIEKVERVRVEQTF